MSEVRHAAPTFEVVHHTGRESSVYITYREGDRRHTDVLCTCESDTEDTAATRATRIADCVTACEGIADPATLRRQRDRMLAACRLVDSLDLCEGYSPADSELRKLWDALTAARAAVRDAEDSQ